MGRMSTIRQIQVPEGKTVKNRVHLDVRADSGLEGEAANGTTSNGFLVMADPGGNEFCLD
jgi:hypothetical protein